MNLPITSRIKRSPLMQTSEEDKKKKNIPSTVDIGGSIDGEDEIIKGTKGTPPSSKITHEKAYANRGPEYQSLSLDDYITVAKKHELYGTSGSPGTPGTPNVVVKGKGIDYDGTAKIETKGDVLHSHEIRDLSRGTKKVTKDVTDTKRKIDKTSRRQQKMIDKYDTVDPKTGKKDGKISDEERSKMSTGFLGFGNKQAKYDRLKRRSEENTSRLEINKAAVEHNKITRASGKRAGTSDVRTGERDMSMSELESNLGSVKIQEAHLKKKAEIAVKREAAAESQKITTSSTEGSKSDSDKAVAGYAGQAANAPKVGTTTVTPNYNYGKFGRYPYRMKGSMFNKK